jgi:hypothetical protein
MDDSKLVKLCVVGGMIERDSILAALEDSEIEAHGEERLLSRKITSTTTDISYEGYSALADTGFAIWVNPKDLPKAQQIVGDLKVQASAHDNNTRIDHVAKFNTSVLFGILIPFLFHVIAIYHLAQARKLGQWKNLSATTKVCCLVFCLSFGCWTLLVASAFFDIENLFFWGG